MNGWTFKDDIYDRLIIWESRFRESVIENNILQDLTDA